MSTRYETVILGAGASGMMTAALLDDKTGVLLLEGNARPGAKLAVSGGGRCNLTNRDIHPRYYRGDPKLLRAVFSRYDRRWLVSWFERRGVRLRPEEGGKYFCVDGAAAVNRSLASAWRGVEFRGESRIETVEKRGELLVLSDTAGRTITTRRLVVASGGLSYPRLGAGGIGMKIAETFGHDIVRPSPVLTGWTLQPSQAFFKTLSGISVDVTIRIAGRRWPGRLLFAHRGLSGPAVLNASLWWERGEVSVDFLPGFSLHRLHRSPKNLSTLLPMPRRAARAFLQHLEIRDRSAAKLSREELARLERLHDYRFAPAGTFGYARAEAMRGGVSTEEIDPRSLESLRIPGLYFVGEVLDVTGEVGGYNLQWAFSSAAVCAESLNRNER